MKRIILIILFLCGLYPSVRQGRVVLMPIQQAFAQSNLDGVEICSTTTEDITIVVNGDEVTETTTTCYVGTDCETGEEIGDRHDCKDVEVVTGPCSIYGPDATMEDCGCVGPGTGVADCGPDDCNGEAGGSAYDSDCGCIGGSTGINECLEELPETVPDCFGTPNGTARRDACGECVGGETGKTATKWYQDADGDGWGGTTSKTCYSPGSGWVNKGGDKNDGCYNVSNDPDQCTVCDPTYSLYDPVACDCPCLKKALEAMGGLMRNYNGDIIKEIGTGTGYGPYPEGAPLMNITIRQDFIYTPDGHRYPVETVLSATDINTGLPLSSQAIENLGYNCLGYALADGEYIVDSNNTNFVNSLLGVTDIATAIGNSTFQSNFANIQSGQILLVLNGSSTGYVHAAVYDANGYYFTKNGMGTGNEGTEHMTLAQIQAIYSGVYMFTNAPGKISLTSNIGSNTDGKSTYNAILNALNNCDCNP
ncbi:hypothetical protein QFZ20_002130 [Flavobacterium sp. W4I14]|nr:hypothetical protein [Flavobacterium sp. W4I14]